MKSHPSIDREYVTYFFLTIYFQNAKLTQNRTVYIISMNHYKNLIKINL